MTEQLHFHFSLSCIGEGNGNSLQCSCLESPRDGGAWWAAIYGVAQSWTRLKWLSSRSSSSDLLLISSLIPLWPENGHCIISILKNLLRCVLWLRMWFIWINVLCGPENIYSVVRWSRPRCHYIQLIDGVNWAQMCPYQFSACWLCPFLIEGCWSLNYDSAFLCASLKLSVSAKWHSDAAVWHIYLKDGLPW